MIRWSLLRANLIISACCDEKSINISFDPWANFVVCVIKWCDIDAILRNHKLFVISNDSEFYVLKIKWKKKKFTENRDIMNKFILVFAVSTSAQGS